MKNVKMIAIVALTALSTQIATAMLPVNNGIQPNTIVLNVQDFVEIEIAALPETVQETVNTTFEGAEVTKAFVSKEGVYKLEIAQADLQKTIYVNSEGELVDL